MAFKIFHLDCGSLCPHQCETLFGVSHLSCHCLLIETPKNLVLVDTGLSNLYLSENSAFHKKLILRPRLDETQLATHQIEKLGYKASDVTDIIATHLDQDHIGAVHEFKNARLHLHELESQYLSADYVDKVKRFSNKYLKNCSEIIYYDTFGENWNGFQCVRQLRFLPPEIVLVPLVGHTAGHSGVAVQEKKGWLLHAGDAFFVKEDLEKDVLKKNFKSEIYQTLNAEHNKNRIHNLGRLSDLQANSKTVKIINSHDPRYL